MTLERFLSNRKYFETGFWFLVFITAFTSESAIVYFDSRRQGISIEIWEILTWEGSSNFILMCLVPLLLLFDRNFPLGWSKPRSNVFAHIMFTVFFSLSHVVSMVCIRKGVYWLMGGYYDFGEPLREFFYEYLKDFRTYAIFISLIYLYRHVVFRLQGEASILGKPDEGLEDYQSAGSERFLVKKLGREFLISVNNIERIEAAGNYVNLYVGERIYPLRETMGNIEKRLDPENFRRIHRSHIINLNYVQEIRPLETGDARVLLNSGHDVPMSRTYRTVLKGMSERA